MDTTHMVIAISHIIFTLISPPRVVGWKIRHIRVSHAVLSPQIIIINATLGAAVHFLDLKQSKIRMHFAQKMREWIFLWTRKWHCSENGIYLYIMAGWIQVNTTNIQATWKLFRLIWVLLECKSQTKNLPVAAVPITRETEGQGESDRDLLLGNLPRTTATTSSSITM